MFGYEYTEIGSKEGIYTLWIFGLSFMVQSPFPLSAKYSIRNNPKFNVEVKETGKKMVVHKRGRFNGLTGLDSEPVYVSTKDYQTEYLANELIF